MKKIFFQILNGFFSFCNKTIIFCTKYPALILTLLAALVVSILVLLVRNETNVGGLFGKILELFGVKSKTPIEQANTIPSNRKQALEEADEKGFVQHKVSELETSLNPFRDKGVVVLPDGKKVQLPSGIKDTDVDVVIEAGSSITIIPHKENYEKALGTQEVIKQAEQTNSKAQDLLTRLKAKQNA
jgi:hypothetical protein